MTNRDMVKPEPDGPAQRPNRTPLPPLPAEKGSPAPTTDREPIDAPQPNASPERTPPAEGEIGLSTKR